MSTPTITPGISWQQDYNDRVNPGLMTRLLRSAIPVLDHSRWYVESVEEGFCKSVLPLSGPTTNQHGTHQAALISLSADYTGGLALATLLRGVPLAGVHRCSDEESASLWLASMNVKYRHPSTGHLTGVCRVDDEKANQIRNRYFSGNRVLVALNVEFYSNDDLVAVAEMKYFAQPTIQLIPAPGSRKVSNLFSHKLKASARMIAGVRAKGSDHPRLTVTCPHAVTSAGPHGKLLADRLHRILPQLTEMVLARTQHIDEVLAGVPDLQQVVMLGAGLDMRSIRHAARMPGVCFFEIDLPDMIEERLRITSQFPIDYREQRFQLEADFRNDDVSELLRNHLQFDAQLPTLFIYEGCSMYFSDVQNRQMLARVRSLMQHPDSTLWMDIVSPEVANGRTNHRSIAAFLEGMDELGESFIFGLEDPVEWLLNQGFSGSQRTRCGDYLEDGDLVKNTYSFLTCRH